MDILGILVIGHLLDDLYFWGHCEQKHLKNKSIPLLWGEISHTNENIFSRNSSLAYMGSSMNLTFLNPYKLRNKNGFESFN